MMSLFWHHHFQVLTPEPSLEWMDPSLNWECNPFWVLPCRRILVFPTNDLLTKYIIPFLPCLESSLHFLLLFGSLEKSMVFLTLGCGSQPWLHSQITEGDFFFFFQMETPRLHPRIIKPKSLRMEPKHWYFLKPHPMILIHSQCQEPLFKKYALFSCLDVCRGFFPSP